MPKPTHRALNVIIPLEVKEELDDLAKKLNIPTSKLARNLLILGMEDMQMFEKFKLISFMGYLNKLEDRKDSPSHWKAKILAN